MVSWHSFRATYNIKITYNVWHCYDFQRHAREIIHAEIIQEIEPESPARALGRVKKLKGRVPRALNDLRYGLGFLISGMKLK